MKIKTLRSILEYLLVICIILEFYTVYGAMPLIKRLVQITPAFILLTLIIITPQRLSRTTGLCVIAYFMGAIVPMLNIRSDTYISYIKDFVVMLPLLWIYLSKRKQAGVTAYLSLFFKYSDTVTWLATISLVMWLFCSVLQVIPMTGLAPYAWSSNVFFVPSYYNIYFETQSIDLLGVPFMRNTGIFNEGPMYNMVLCVSLAIEYFIRSVKSKPRITILVIAIFSTFTTTGQLFLLALLAWHILRKTAGRYHVLILIMAPLVIIGVYIMTSTIMDFKSDTGGDHSIDSRTWDIMNCIDAGMKNPLLGIGIVQSKDITIWEGTELGYSNSLFTLFAKGGLYVLTLYLFALLIVPCLYYCKYKQSRWMITMLCYFTLFSFTTSIERYLTLLFLAWGLSNIDMVRWNRQFINISSTF